MQSGGYLAQQQPGYAAVQQPGYAPVQQPGYGQMEQAGYGSMQQPGYAPTQQPGYGSMEQQGGMQQGIGAPTSNPSPVTLRAACPVSAFDAERFKRQLCQAYNVDPQNTSGDLIDPRNVQILGATPNAQDGSTTDVQVLLNSEKYEVERSRDLDSNFDS